MCNHIYTYMYEGNVTIDVTRKFTEEFTVSLEKITHSAGV